MAGLATLMDTNFDLRLSMFGEAALGEANLKMISLARKIGGEILHHIHFLQPFYDIIIVPSISSLLLSRLLHACPQWQLDTTGHIGCC